MKKSSKNALFSNFLCTWKLSWKATEKWLYMKQLFNSQTCVPLVFLAHLGEPGTFSYRKSNMPDC